MKDFLARFAKRYIAGTERSDALEVVRGLNARGIITTIDVLGENVDTTAEAAASVEEYLALLDDIATEGLKSTVSLKLTHLGLDISEELAYENTLKVVRRAEQLSNFVRVDMESSKYTQATIDTVVKLRRECENVGVALQSALKRSADDAEMLIREKIGVRLVKGAYKEPPEIAFEAKSDVDKNYEAIMKRLLPSGLRTAVATHDERLIRLARAYAHEHGLSPEAYEFQMLLGIKRSLQQELADDGYTVRVYVPYGPDWKPYILRRLTERKENFYFVLKHILD